MKTLLCTCNAETPGLFRVGVLHRAAGELVGGVVVAWLMRSGKFAMPTSPREAGCIADMSREKAEKELYRAASLLEFVSEMKTP